MGDSKQIDEFKPFPGFATQAIHAGQEPEQWNSRAVVPPLSLSTTFKQEEPGVHSGYEYSRSGNPTRDCTEKCVAALENAKYCMLFASGLAATTSLCHLMKTGDHMIAMKDLYGGTNRYFRKILSNFGIETSFVDLTVPGECEKAIRPNTRMVWIETPTNPTMQVVDIAAVSAEAHKHENIIVVVDNTFATPYFQRPIDLGADCSFNSVSKYLNGHSDVIMGCVSTSNDDIHDRLRFLQNAIGTIPAPFDCYLLNRGLKTMAVRMQQHYKNATAVAKFLESDPRATKVLYPGLPSHPNYEVAVRQMRGFSGMITFYINGGLEASRLFLKNLKVFTLAESLGGFESLAEHPAIMTHASVAPEERAVLGISDSLVRLSVGLEDESDLISDLDNALELAVGKK